MALFDIAIGRIAIKSNKYPNGTHGEGYPLRFYYFIQNRYSKRIFVIYKEMGVPKYEDSIIDGLRELGSEYPKVFYSKLLDADKALRTSLLQRRYHNSLENPDLNVAVMFYDDDKQLLVVSSRGVDINDENKK